MRLHFNIDRLSRKCHIAWGRSWARCNFFCTTSASLKAFTHRMLFFRVILLHVIYIFWTADWTWVFSHRTWISHCKKATLLFFSSRLIFQSFPTANKGINRSQWLRGTNNTSVSHCRTEVLNLNLASAIFERSFRLWQTKNPSFLKTMPYYIKGMFRCNL